MKKGLAIIFCVLLLAACAAPQSAGQKGVEETAVFVNPNAVKAGAYGALYFEANGYRFGIYDKMEDVLAHVPSNTTFTGESCAFEGDDIYYFFNGFEIMANVIDGAERTLLASATPGQWDASAAGLPLGEDFVSALAAASRYRLERSRVFSDRFDELAECCCAVFARMVDHCRRRRKRGFVAGLFGDAVDEPYAMFRSAVFYDPVRHPDCTVELM
ncbi:MAG: hypothetical protein IJH59_08880, partial [Firmicutes bacterium]|nr:hypothetical protein [Bacillota bacterium]